MAFIFDTMLTEEVFSKCRLAARFTESALLAEESGHDSSFKFTPYSFNEVLLMGEGYNAHITLSGEDWGDNPVPLLSLFSLLSSANETEESKAEKGRAVKALLLSIKAIKDFLHIEMPAIPYIPGAGGIYVSSNNKVLFLPPLLFDQISSLNGEKEYARVQGLWCSKALTQDNAYNSYSTAFTCASIMYFALTKKIPYSNMDETERDADIYDKRYLPLELSINGVDTGLSKTIDTALEMPSVLLHTKEKEGTSQSLPAALDFDIDAFCKEAGFNAIDNSLTSPSHPNAVKDEEFTARVEEYYKKREGKLKARRVVRRNRALIAAVFIALIVTGGISTCTYKDYAMRPTMKGLTSGEVTQVFYKAINEQDVQMITTASQGKVSHEYGDDLSQVFVSGKMRSMYEEGGIVTLEAWLLRHTKGSVPNTVGVYSIAHFSIDGKEVPFTVKVPRRKDKVKEVGFSTGESAVHKAEYYFIHTEGEERTFYCDKRVDTVTLTYKKDKWLISDIKRVTSEIDVSCFEKDLDAELEKGGIYSALSSLRHKYSWLPSDEAIRQQESAEY